MRRAVIDVGSNSVLLLVAEQQGSGWSPVLETSRVTGLGRGVRETGHISEEGALPTLRALREAFDHAQSLGAGSVLAVGTMALRLATNRDEFLSQAAAQGTPVEVMTGDREAELGLLAVVHDPLIRSQQHITVIDVGGHSTELVNAEVHPDRVHVRYQASHPVGTLGLREGPLRKESPTSLDLLAASAKIDDLIGCCFLPGACGVVVALGASATNLVTIREQMTTWDPKRVHGQRLSYEEISRAAAWLSSLSESQRAALVGIEPGRESTIHLGALLLERFLFAARAEELLVSVRGWRHALLESG